MKQLRAIVSIISVSFCAASAQNPNNAVTNTRYLALGDSVAFGYNPTVPVSLRNYEGYPELVSDAVHQNVANASCVGETSGSFIAMGAPDLGCAQWKQLGLPMWVPYQGSQLEYAVSYLRGNPNTKLVTINLGGNDLGLLQQNCQNVLACELSGLPKVLLSYAVNLQTIFSRIRGTGYRGPVVLLTYYSTTYTDPVIVTTYEELNSVGSLVATLFGAHMADGFKAFQTASAGSGGDPCAAGLLIPLPDGTCNIHPSLLGQQVLADAVVKVVDAIR